MKVKFKNVVKVDQTKVICDTNVWYGYNQGKPTETDENHVLIPTFLTLAELATSEVMVHDIKLFQDTIRAIYERCGPIITLDPIDYVLSQQDPSYPATDRGIKKLLEGFSYLLSIEIDDKAVVDDKLKKAVVEKCKIERKASVSFAEYANSKVDEIRNRINTGIGKKKHLEIDTTDINKEMMKSIFKEHVKGSEYTIDWDKFDWGKIDLFIKATEIFFKKVETTKGMKVNPNDAVDWLNMLYVSPDDKYLTLEGSWRNYIEEDDRIKHYLYE
jgi:hypothetical protein